MSANEIAAARFTAHMYATEIARLDALRTHASAHELPAIEARIERVREYARTDVR